MIIGRAFPIRPHLAQPVVSHAPVLPPAKIVSQAIARSANRRLRDVVPAPHVAPPVVSHRQPVRPAIVIVQSINRGQMAFAARFLPFRAHVPRAVIPRGPPVLPATVVSQPRTVPFAGVGQSLLRPFVGRSLPRKALVAPPVIPQPFVAPPPIEISQAIERAREARWRDVVPAPHLPQLGGAQPVSPGTFKPRAISRALLDRGGRVSVAPPLVAPPFIAPAPLLISQARQRPLFGRTVPLHARVPPTPPRAGPGITIVQVVPWRRFYIRNVLEPHLARPVLAVPFVAPPPLIIQVVPWRRAYTGRSILKAHLAPAVLASPFIAPPPLIIQVVPWRRAYTGRTAPRPHLATARVAQFIAPEPLVISQALRRPYVGRTVPRPRLAPPVIPEGPPGPPPLVVSARLRLPWEDRKLRDTPPGPHLAPPVLARPGPGGTYRYQAVGRMVRLGTPATKIIWAPSPPPVPQGTFIYQARQRPFIGRTVPRPHLAAGIVTPSTAPFLAAPPLVVSQARQRPYIGRSGYLHLPSTPPPPPRGATVKLQVQRQRTGWTPPRPHLAPPAFPPAPRGRFIYQAVQRALTGRTVPLRPRVAPPVIPEGPPGPPPLVVSVRPRLPWTDRKLRDVPPAPHLAPPVQTRPGPGATIKLQSIQRPYIGRTVSLHPRLPVFIPAPVPRGTFVYQSIQRPLLGRGPFPPKHLAPGLVSPQVGFHSTPILISQAIQRSQYRRWRDVVPAPRVAPPVKQPAGPGATIRLQFQARALIDRRGRVHLPPPASPRPVRPGTFIYQAWQRAQLGRTVPLRAQVAKPLVSTFAPVPIVITRQALTRALVGRGGRVHSPSTPGGPPVPPGLFRYQAISRALLGRGGHVRLPPTPRPPFPVPVGTFIEQALRRSYVGRTVPRSHLAAAVVAPAFIAPEPLVISQSRQRPFLGRSIPLRPRVAPPVPTRAGPGITIKLQSLARQLVDRRGRIHATGPIVSIPVIPGATIKLQAVPRALLGRGGHVRVAPPVRTLRGPGITIVSQAMQRPFVGRRIIPAHAPPTSAPVPLPPALVISQARQRPYVGRTVILRPRVAHVAISVVPPGPPAKVISQAIQRALRGRGPFPPKHLAAPIVFPYFKAPPAVQLSQALARPYLGRTIPKPHVAPSTVNPAPGTIGPEGPVNVNPLGPRVGLGPEHGVGVSQGPGVGLGGPSQITVRGR